MTLRTLTFDPALYKLVPAAPIPKMLIAAGTVRGYDGATPDEDHIAWWDEMLAAVPDTLPGVVEHSGEEAAWLNPNESFAPKAIIWHRDIDCHPEYSVPLFTHPAPAQPVERQELSQVATIIQKLIDSHKRDVGGECDESCDIIAGMEAARDAIIAKDRGQA